METMGPRATSIHERITRLEAELARATDPALADKLALELQAERSHRVRLQNIARANQQRADREGWPEDVTDVY